ncbi:UDP-N-acetylmuramoylalanine/D-glutamate ligase [Hyphomicrobium denitrificans ATCC 51888]|uniref:UDP-N-acetylmuramoylalanine--D-glutamate ligase n=1 Tax=Hyphomicrobium denitrificans (strain ATCC 51888 / DSM 1869 / NCIMB 11706 / TK 0415) TaxID=582899 RepID=D8JQR4_HYPDA|nr:UDP-N-acetylmuramoyl-L-alanine--D-glutamate ligase [Hyphomicrobium denitrificans]ADJ22066.1 UDP-N-acetylmuramoylalanine/D-glutamate ligase [Hyphomicrobium denitrificans ATCC 51888]
MIRATSFNGKTVAVFGLGGSGIASARSLLAGGATVAAWDDGEAGRSAAAREGVPLVDLAEADWSQFSALVLAPGVPLTHPEPHWTVRKAQDSGVEIIGDIEIFARERAAQAPDAPFIGITGTNGKSTTTALIAHILRHAGRDVQLGGNIGRAVLTLEDPAPERCHVIELSSFQIDLTPTLKPTVGVMLNVTPDHLDRHGTIENYAAVKERLVDGAEVAAVGLDDEFGLAMLQRRIQKAPAIAFSAEKSIAPGYSLLDDTIICSNREALAVKLASLGGIATLRGKHNAQNALAAVAAVRECLNWIGQSSDLDWQGALASFPGLPHRMEEIGRIGNVLFVNDSKATNADSTEKALLSFPRDVFWIAGGKPKAGGISALEKYFGGVAKVYLIGESSEDFAQTLEGKVTFERSGTLDAAVAAAARDAKASTGAEPVVLLSPACASYDQFRNFEVRGDAFRKLVEAVPGVAMRGAK